MITLTVVPNSAHFLASLQQKIRFQALFFNVQQTIQKQREPARVVT